MRYFILTVSLIITLSLTSAHADQVLLKNGDRLTGTIEKMVEGKLTLKSDLAGTVEIDFTNIQTISSDKPIKVHLNDGTILNQKLVESDPNSFAVAPSDTIKTQKFKMAAVTSINPPPKPDPKWTGDFSAAYTLTTGNTQNETVSASMNLRKRTKNDRTHIGGDYARSRQQDPTTKVDETIEDWWRLTGKYDYFFRPKVFAFFDGRYEKDAVAELDRRVILGAGGGYQWIETKKTNFATRAGIASLYEKFDNQTQSNSEISAQLGYDFDRQLAKTVKFIHDLTWYPSVRDFSDYFMTSTSELRADITESIFTNFKIIFNYDATPAIGKGDTDVKYIVGVGGKF
ncbi:MAG: DUF481 domain-containing protein [Planctomycetota bacterium]|jgi:putative salt-induced outer membrane protein YdiY